MSDNEKKLKPILKSIEKVLGISLLDFPKVLGFGGEFEFDVCHYVDRSGLRLWRSINIETGLYSSLIAYEPGSGSHWGEILFYASDEHDLVVILDPEVPVGLIFQTSDSNIIENTDGWRRDFHYSAEWRKEASKSSKKQSYIDEWPTLLARLTNTPKMVL